MTDAPLTTRSPELPPAVAAMVAVLAPDEPICHASPVGLRQDTGSWLWRTRVWLVRTPEQLLLLAPGRKPWSRCLPVSRLRGSFYNHAIRRLVLASDDGEQFESLGMSPARGARLVAELTAEESDDGQVPA